MAGFTYEELAQTGPKTIAGQYLRRFWHPIALSSDLPEQRAKPIRVLGEAFTLYRGDSGAVFLVEFQCPHRGTQLSTGWVEDDTLRCRYHGWRFRGDGQCVEQPAEEAAFAEKIRMASYPVQEYLGLIFAYLGSGPPPELPRYSWMEEPGILRQEMYQRNCNYFFSLDNGPDPVHVGFAHSGSAFDRSGLRGVPEVTAEETTYGMKVSAQRANGKVRVNHFLMPTGILIKSSPEDAEDVNREWRDHLAWRVPIDDRCHLSFSVDLVHVQPGEEDAYFARREREAERMASLEPHDEVVQQILSGRITIEEVADRPDIVGIQDDVTQMGQEPWANRPREHLGRSDAGLILWRRLWYRELASLGDGQELTDWQIPARLAAISGV